MTIHYGKLYVVATPIGNLADFSYRAVEILKQVDYIAAEDTRHVRVLLQHYGITNKLLALHQHNEEQAAPGLLEKLQQGMSIALVSDAGTPLLSDPGMPLVKLLKNAGIEVSPIPGACALIAALSVSGLPLNRFEFEGFLARTSAARIAFLNSKRNCESTWAFYEASHRIEATLQDMLKALPPEREIVIAREITKLHETIIKATLAEVSALVTQDPNMRKGEFVVIVAGAVTEKQVEALTDEQQRILQLLLRECSTKTAVALAVEITGARKKALYQAALDSTFTKSVEDDANI
ncbi:MAG: 16S rRNA (cytidine(1402)-2'-O)-methyltransferase [Methylococcales bacterium]